jgi:Protein of unknown function (DUF1203)
MQVTQTGRVGDSLLFELGKRIERHTRSGSNGLEEDFDWSAGGRSKFQTRNRGAIVMQNKIVAIATEVADTVRETMRAPVYGFPAHKELVTDAAPCRHCLRLITPQVDDAILFTYDRFTGVEELPQPGPIYVHAKKCSRYDEHDGFPEELRGSARTLEAYARGRRLIAQEYVADGAFEGAIARLFLNREVDYLQVHSTTAGCFTFRIERTGDS